MQNDLRKRFENYIKEKKNRKRACLIIALLSVVIATSVFGALSLPALSMATDEPILEAMQVAAELGDDIAVRVTAEAPMGDEEAVFVLHAQGNGSGLSDSFVFDENGVCIVADETENKIELHRTCGEDGETDFWFALAPDQETAFLLRFNSDMWEPPKEEEPPELPQQAEPPEEGNSEESDTDENTAPIEPAPGEPNENQAPAPEIPGAADEDTNEPVAPSEESQADPEPAPEEPAVPVPDKPSKPEKDEGAAAGKTPPKGGILSELFLVGYALDEDTAEEVLGNEESAQPEKPAEDKPEDNESGAEPQQPENPSEPEPDKEEQQGGGSAEEPAEPPDNSGESDTETPPAEEEQSGESETHPSEEEAETPPAEDDDAIEPETPPIEEPEEPDLSFLAKEGEDQHLTIWGGMGDDYKSALRAAKARKEPLELTWKEHLEEITLTAETDTGILITLTGMENAFPAGDFTLEAEELVKQAEPTVEEPVKPDDAMSIPAVGAAADPISLPQKEDTPEEADMPASSDTENAAAAEQAPDDTKEPGRTEEPAPLSQQAAQSRLEQAAEDAGVKALETRLFDIRLLCDGEEVELLGPVNVTFTGLTEELLEAAQAKVFHIDGKTDVAADMAARLLENGDLVMETDHFSLFGVVLSAAIENAVSVQDILNGLGVANQFAVFANEMQAQGHMEGSIAVRELTLAPGAEFDFGNTSNVGQQAGSSSKVTLTIIKEVTGAEPQERTSAFGVFDRMEQQVAKETITGAGSVTVDLPPGNYRVYELDDQGNKLEHGQGDGYKVYYDALNMSGFLGGGGENYVNNASYIETFKRSTITGMKTQNAGALYVGEHNTINQSNRTITTKDGYTVNAMNAQAGALRQPTHMDFEGTFERLISLSRTLGGCTATDYDRGDLRTPGVTFLNITVPADGLIEKSDIARTIGDPDQNLNHGIPLGEEQYLVINLDCSRVPKGTEVTLPDVAVNSNNAAGWKADYCRLIWNMVSGGGCYTGKTNMQNAAAGTILAPKGTVEQNATFGGSILADKVIRGSDEIHQHSFRHSGVAQTIVTNAYDGVVGLTSVRVSKEWAGDEDDTSSRPARVTVHLLANGEATGAAIQLSGENSWSHTWTELPKTDPNGNSISYTVEEEPIDGYKPSYGEGTVQTAESGWQQADAFTNGGKYLLVYNNDRSALRYSGSGNTLAAANASGLLAGDAEAAGNALWIASGVDGSDVTLTNAVSTDRQLRHYSSRNNRRFGAYQPNTGNIEPIRYANGRISSGGILGGIGARYAGGLSGGYLSAERNANDAVQFTLYEWHADAGEVLSFVITNTKRGEGVLPQASMVHNKTIDALRDGVSNPDTTLDDSGADMTDFYRLYLDMSGRQEGVDLLIVVDRSGSMDIADMRDGGRTIARDTAVTKVLNGSTSTTTAEGLIPTFLAMNEENRVAVTTFEGQTDIRPNANQGYRYTKDSAILMEWTGMAQFVNAVNRPKANGTNYEAGLMMADAMFNQVGSSGNRKVMIFLSDGVPTYYLDKELNRKGNGAYDDTRNVRECKPGSEDAFDDFHREHSDVTVFTVGISDDFNGSNASESHSPDVLRYMADKSGGTFQGVEDVNELVGMMIGALYPYDVTISDHLSRYVAWHGAQPDVKVTMTGSDGGTATLWQGTGSAESGTIGQATAANQTTQNGKRLSIVSDVTYTPGSHADTTGTVEVKFDPAYCMSPEYTYTLSYNVKTTQTAYDEHQANLAAGDATGYLDVRGDPQTDYPGNDTSSEHPGFHSNEEATVKYEIGGMKYEEPYDHPVIQVKDEKYGLTIRKTDVNGTRLLAGAEFDLYRAAAAGSGGAGIIPGTDDAYGIKINIDSLVIPESGELTVGDLTPGEFYLVETRAPSGYQLLKAPIHFNLAKSGIALLGAAAEQNLAEVLSPEAGGLPILVVKNTDGYHMPDTGGVGTWFFTVAGLLIMVGALVSLGHRWRRERRVH